MKYVKFLLCTLPFCASIAAHADANIEAVPTGWRLQQYTGSNMYVYYTGSPCPSGSLLLATSTSDNDKNRFWSMIMTAKATGRAVGVFYETSSGTCAITSFYFP